VRARRRCGRRSGQARECVVFAALSGFAATVARPPRLVAVTAQVTPRRASGALSR
jgi:hypothetical protein